MRPLFTKLDLNYFFSINTFQNEFSPLHGPMITSLHIIFTTMVYKLLCVLKPMTQICKFVLIIVIWVSIFSKRIGAQDEELNCATFICHGFLIGFLVAELFHFYCSKSV